MRVKSPGVKGSILLITATTSVVNDYSPDKPENGLGWRKPAFLASFIQISKVENENSNKVTGMIVSDMNGENIYPAGYTGKGSRIDVYKTPTKTVFDVVQPWETCIIEFVLYTRSTESQRTDSLFVPGDNSPSDSKYGKLSVVALGGD
jgi:hypothetical protein